MNVLVVVQAKMFLLSIPTTRQAASFRNLISTRAHNVYRIFEWRAQRSLTKQAVWRRKVYETQAEMVDLKASKMFSTWLSSDGNINFPCWIFRQGKVGGVSNLVQVHQYMGMGEAGRRTPNTLRRSFPTTLLRHSSYIWSYWNAIRMLPWVTQTASLSSLESFVRWIRISLMLVATNCVQSV